MRIWITRAAPEAEATAERLRALGHEPLVEPVLEARAVSSAPPDLEGIGALAFTSRNGVRSFSVLSAERALPVFAVGAATAEAAREAGFSAVESADGDVAALAELIARRREGISGAVLYAAPETPAGDLVSALLAHGVTARAEVVYRTEPLELPAAAEQALLQGRLDAVLVHSARAAQALASYEALAHAAPSLELFAISEAASEPLRPLGFARVQAAPFPKEASLLKLLASPPAAGAPSPGPPMTAPDPVQLSAPVDPSAYGRPPRLFTPLFWIVFGFGVLCIVAAVLVVRFGPKLFPAHPPAPAPAPAAAPALSASIDTRLADIQARLDRPPAAAAPAAPSADLASLTQRVERLEADRRRISQAAAAAVAAASLSEAAAGSRPFAGELAVAGAALPASADLRALSTLADTGAPTLAALTSEFPDVADRAAVASRARAQGTGILARIAQAFAAILTIRRVDRLEGKSPDAVLARAQKDLDNGDLKGAVGELAALPPDAREAVASWRAGALRRVEIDRRIGAIRAAALAELTRAASEAPQA
jgi:uroporphyrinogen-III synthase